MVEEAKNLLAIDSPSGYKKEVAEYVMEQYKMLGYEPKMTVKGEILVELGGKDRENGVLLQAHIDTLGAMVTKIRRNGQLKVTPIGGLNANNVETENCRVITKFNGIYEGTFQLRNASVHVNRRYNEKSRDYTEIHGLIGPGVYASHGYERSHKKRCPKHI